MQDIEEVEQQLLERAADISRPIVEATALLPDDAAIAAVHELLLEGSDLDVVAHAYGCTLTRLRRIDEAIKSPPDPISTSARCGWCAMAAGGTIDDWLKQEVRTLEGAGQHASSCTNSPIVRAAAAFILAFDSDAACDSASTSTREAFAALRRVIAP